MPFDSEHIKELISLDKLEEAIELTKNLDEGLYILIKQQWIAREKDSLKGIGQSQAEVRTFIASKLLRLLQIQKESKSRHDSLKSIRKAENENDDFVIQNVRQQFDMRHKGSWPGHQNKNSRRITYFFFAEKHLAFLEVREAIQKSARDGRSTYLLKTLREVLIFLSELEEVLDVDGLQQMGITKDVKSAFSICKNWRSAVLSGDRAKQKLWGSKADLLLFRISKELEEKKNKAEQYS